MNDFNDHSTITDFELGVDKIQIDTSIAADFSALSINTNGAGSAVVTAGGIEIIVSGISTASLTSSNFDFGIFA